MKNSNKITLYNILSTILIQGLAFFTSPIFSRMLGTDNYGIVSLYNTWTMIVSAVFSLQVGSSLHIARTKFLDEEQPKYQSSVLALGTLTYLLFSAVVFLLEGPISAFLKMSPQMMMVMIVHSYGQFCVGFLNSKYTYEFKAGSNFALSVFTSVSSVGLSLLLIYILPPEVNYWGRILGMAGTYVLLSIVTWITIFPKGKCVFRAEYWKFALPLGLPLIFHMLSNYLLGQSDRVMLQQMGTDSMVGIYSLAATFSTVLNIIWSALNNSWAPFYMEYSKNGQIDIMLHRAKNFMELFTVLASGFVLLATEVYHLFADQSFWTGTNLIPIFAVGYYMVFLYGFAVNFEFFKQKTTAVATGTIFAAICNVVLNYLFIKEMGYLGAAIATMISHGLQFLFHYISARYIVGKGDFPFSMGLFMKYTIPFLAIAAFSLLTPNAWYIRWSIGAALGIWELTRMVKRKMIF